MKLTIFVMEAVEDMLTIAIDYLIMEYVYRYSAIYYAMEWGGDIIVAMVLVLVTKILVRFALKKTIFK